MVVREVVCDDVPEVVTVEVAVVVPVDVSVVVPVNVAVVVPEVVCVVVTVVRVQSMRAPDSCALNTLLIFSASAAQSSLNRNPPNVICTEPFSVPAAAMRHQSCHRVRMQQRAAVRVSSCQSQQLNRSQHLSKGINSIN